MLIVTERGNPWIHIYYFGNGWTRQLFIGLCPMVYHIVYHVVYPIVYYYGLPYHKI